MMITRLKMMVSLIANKHYDDSDDADDEARLRR